MKTRPCSKAFGQLGGTSLPLISKPSMLENTHKHRVTFHQVQDSAGIDAKDTPGARRGNVSAEDSPQAVGSTVQSALIAFIRK